MIMKEAVIALLTDFGLAEPFVGIMKGVITQISPGIPTIDITHQIPAGDILRGAVTLWQSAPYFPEGAIFLCVVDPGVGTSRLPMIVRVEKSESSKEQVFIGPDNGLFTFLLKGDYSTYQISNPAYILPNPGKTFHGRDIFAPAAAHAATGILPHEFGPRIDHPIRLPLPRLEQPAEGRLVGQVLYTDHFGNVLTSLGCFERLDENTIDLKPWLPGIQEARYPLGKTRLQLPDGTLLPLARTFGEISPGSCAALIGSTGLLEIVANRQSAADLLGLRAGEPIEWNVL